MVLLAEEISHLDVNSDAIVKAVKAPCYHSLYLDLVGSPVFKFSYCALDGFDNPQPRI
jgi:hypothetical protein